MDLLLGLDNTTSYDPLTTDTLIGVKYETYNDGLNSDIKNIMYSSPELVAKNDSMMASYDKDSVTKNLPYNYITLNPYNYNTTLYKKEYPNLFYSKNFSFV